MDISTEVAAIQAASEGSELRQPLVDALTALNGGTLPAVTSSDAGKILKVGANGWEVGEKSGYMPVPTATLQITENNTYDVTNYGSAVVNISPSGAVLVSKTITKNGTYDPAGDNADGYDEVTVNVPNSNLSDYIQSDSGGLAYIDTGYVIGANSQFEMIAEYDSSGLYMYDTLFGTRPSASVGRGAIQFSPKWGSGTTYMIMNGGASYTEPNWHMYAGQKSEFVLATSYASVTTLNDNSMKYISLDSISRGSEANLFPLFIFGLNNAGARAGQMANMKLYRFRIYESTNLVHEFIPWEDNNNIACLKDTVTGNLKYNASNNGSFTFGSDLGNNE